ncbi:hypothetical protein LMG19089_02858 [Ralstonia edaphis]|uniref:hypothetical protein n=1 Tax=Ralstonia edaphi TaxID=3058599 RepID=UPI0028F59B87|nr:hypothetical protein [Ralstonia sp. LMG 6871]CAJ0701512.1 hypothetical protein LMG19089_02858 [Ralstonia sp. LMG 6871]
MLATIVVMVMTLPKNRGEWAVALISTVVASLCGGAAAIQYFGLATWMTSTNGAMALGGIYFSCGLPGWTIVRWVFNFLNKRKDKDIAEIAAEVADDARKIAAGGQNG